MTSSTGKRPTSPLERGNDAPGPPQGPGAFASPQGLSGSYTSAFPLITHTMSRTQIAHFMTAPESNRQLVINHRRHRIVVRQRRIDIAATQTAHPPIPLKHLHAIDDLDCGFLDVPAPNLPRLTSAILRTAHRTRIVIRLRREHLPALHTRPRSALHSPVALIACVLPATIRATPLLWGGASKCPSAPLTVPVGNTFRAVSSLQTALIRAPPTWVAPVNLLTQLRSAPAMRRRHYTTPL